MTYDNPYNSRRIIVEQQEKLEQIFFEKDRKREERFTIYKRYSIRD